jgi:uncharacterized tellurite resistance protein B-like protein
VTFLRRVLGLDRPVAARDLPIEPSTPLPGVPVGETLSVRRIAARLATHPPAEARYLAAFAYLLNRAAQADLAVSDVEAREMARLIAEAGRLAPSDAELVMELARYQQVEHGASEDFLVTREFKAISTPDQRVALLRCCFLVASADDEIGPDESWLVNRLAEELDVPRPDLNRIRAEFHERLSSVRSIRRHASRG